MSKRTPRYMLPAHSSATRNSITDEEIRQRRGNTSKGKTHDRSPTHARSSRKLTYEEIIQINAAERNMSGRPTLPPRDDQNNREHQHAKSTLKVPDNDWNSYISDHIDREYPSASRSPEFPDENLKYTLTDQYDRRHHLAKSTLESPGDNLNPSHSDHYKREYQYRSSSLESSDDDLDILEPSCPQMPRTDYELSNAFSRLKLSSTRDYELSYTTYDKGSTLGVKDNRSSHPTSGVGFTLGTKDNWLSDTTRGRRNLDVQVNEKLGGLVFTERNPDPYKTFVEDESGHRPRSPMRREPLISGSSNDEYYSYRNTRDSASMLHGNQRSPSQTSTGLRISGTFLQGHNLRSPSQTKTDFRGSFSYDAKDKEKKQEKTPVHPHSKTKLRKSKKLTNLELCDNLLYYRGKIKSKPAPGYTITEMLKWKGDYGMLEKHHLYMSWLFPIHESKGLNKDAQVLTDYEAKEIQKDKAAHERVLEAYRMMLDFYGMILINERDGTLLRADNYIERYDNISRCRHNLSCITRIIKSMGELGYQRLQAPLVNFLYVECVIERKFLNFRQSTFDHWINAIYDDNERMKMYRLFHGFTDDLMENEFMATVTAEVRDIKDEEKDDIVAHASENRTVYPSADSPNVSVSNKTATSIKYDEMREREPTPDKGNGEPTKAEHKRDKSKSKPEGKSGPVITQDFQINSKDGKTLELPERTSQTVVSDHGARTKDRKSPTQTRRDSPLQITQRRTDTDLSHVENKNYRLDDLGAVGRSTEGAMDIDDTYQCDNLRFYRNEIQSRPSPGYTIETILQHCDDHCFLDNYPYFIKWLFPTPNSLNINTQPLLPHEIKAIQRDEKTSNRVLRAYVLVLNYYGIMIVDKHTGKLKKSKNWKSRWEIINLNNEHEFKHITRVLVSLGELGYERYQVPLIEIFIKNKDVITEFEWNSIRHWIENVNDEEQQKALFEKYGKNIFSKKTLDAYSQRTLEAYSQKTLEAYSQKTLEAYSQKPLEAYSQKTLEAYSQKPLKAYSQKPLEAYSQKTLEASSQKPLEASSQKPLEASSQKPLEAYDTQTKHEQQHSGYDNTFEQLGTIGS